ncbi:MAG: NrfD/PsrC family molybdoenzyme membrane anchor subunit [Phycisphaeraceae bacterium]
MATIHPQILMTDQNTYDHPSERPPLVTGANDFTTVTDKVVNIALGKPTAWWWIAFGITSFIAMLFFVQIGILFATGVGIWGNNQPASWGFPIINFVFWVGIGHAGTLISAILFLFRQNWRTSINRFAEAMTIFAVVCAGVFPLIHVGRPWLAFWLFPYPNQMAMWPQFRSPLLWDVFAVSTYFSVSLAFWYVGMVPDLATIRDRAKNRLTQIFYGVLSMGWNGSSRHWQRYERMYLLLAALATPLVLSVHSVVSFDFAISQLPGWHTTIFPPYFVAGAIYGGFAMVLTLAIPSRVIFGIKDLITMRHVDLMCKVMLGTGLIVTFAYVVEFFIAWYSNHHFEQFLFLNRPFGPYKWVGFAMMFTLNCVIPQILWFRWCRMNVWTVMLAAMSINAGMWFERYVIVVTSLTRDFLPSSWDDFMPTFFDYSMFFCSFGLFLSLFLIFLKVLPIIAIAEVKTVMPGAHEGHGHGEDHHGEESDR